jgi:hypothetical protein
MSAQSLTLSSTGAAGAGFTGVHSPSANALALSTTGSDGLVLTATGTVGVGTSSPAAKLDVNGTLRSSGQATLDGLAYPTTLTSGGLLYGSSSSAIASSGAFTQNAVMLGGGAGAAPSTVVGLGTAGQVLTSNGAGTPPTFQNITPPSPFGNQNDVTASRSCGTVYQNTSGKTMFVSITGSSGASIFSDSSNPPTTQVAVLGTATASTTGSFMVLNNNYYEAGACGGGGLVKWIEWN